MCTDAKWNTTSSRNTTASKRETRQALSFAFQRLSSVRYTHCLFYLFIYLFTLLLFFCNYVSTFFPFYLISRHSYFLPAQDTRKRFFVSNSRMEHESSIFITNDLTIFLVRASQYLFFFFFYLNYISLYSSLWIICCQSINQKNILTLQQRWLIELMDTQKNYFIPNKYLVSKKQSSKNNSWVLHKKQNLLESI